MLKAVLMGVAGSGKTSVGLAVATQIGATYFDADDHHPQSNIDKMSAGNSLNDADRQPWLDAIGAELARASGPTIVGCSALKRAYRDRIRLSNPNVMFVHLSGSREVVASRMSARSGHFMPLSLLESQFVSLEPLEPDEQGFDVDIRQEFAAVVEEVSIGLLHEIAS